MNKLISSFLILILSGQFTFAQNYADEAFSARQNLGVTFGAGLNFHNGNFKELPGISCCTDYTTAVGFGFNAGIFYGVPLSDDFELLFRANYQDLGVEFVETESFSFSPGDKNPTTVANGEIQYTLNNSINSIGLDSYFAWRMTKQFKLLLGFRMGYILGATATQEERILDPSYGTYIDTGKKTRATYDGDIPDAATLESSILLGASYDLPLNENHTLFLVPQADFNIGVSSLVKDLGWTASLFRGMVSIKYAPRELVPPPKPIIPPPPPPYPHIGVPPPPPPPKIALLDATITAVAVEPDGSESPVSTLRTEEFLMNRTHPILNYIFFDENSSAIPSRYTRISEEEKASFSFKGFMNAKTMEVYHNVLNILGKRMQFYPQAKITLIGTNSNEKKEKGNKTLSKNRAEAIKSFLLAEWKIDASRISIEARNLPKNPSNKNAADGIEENRRVEIIASQSEVFEPVNIRDTLTESNPPHIRFKPIINAEVGVKSWKITTMQDGIDLRVFEGKGEVASAVDWVLASEDEQDYTHRLKKPLQYRLEVEDNDGKIWKSKIQTLPVKQLTIETKMWNEMDDKEIDKFALIGFGYNKANLISAHKFIGDKAVNRIREESTTNITGYSDRLGNDDVNKRLSDRRANATAKYLKINTKYAVGVGETIFLYDNNLPEGRFYSRSVHINVETPIEN